MRKRVKWFVIGLATITGALALPAVALAVFPGLNDDILFVSGPVLTGQHRHPNWSADGRQIVFVIRSGATDDVWIHDTRFHSSANFTLSASIREDHPTFSPNGKKIAYESEVFDGNNDTDILVANVDGSGTPVNLTNSDVPIESTPVWSPDGKYIYYARKASAAATDYDIYRELANNTGNPESTLNAMTATAEWQPEISPNGKKLCFTFGDLGADTADVYVANINGSGDAFEFNAADSGTPIADYNCAWSPDGKTIGFTRGKFSTGDLYFGDSSGAGDPLPYGNNDPDNFDGNLDWSRAANTCQGKLVTILGTGHNDNLSGTPKRDVVVLLKGHDRFRGKGGNDIVCGGPGHDTLGGGRGRDTLIGGPGNDDLRGGSGKDRCVGGPGKDTEKGCE